MGEEKDPVSTEEVVKKTSKLIKVAKQNGIPLTLVFAALTFVYSNFQTVQVAKAEKESVIRQIQAVKDSQQVQIKNTADNLAKIHQQLVNAQQIMIDQTKTIQRVLTIVTKGNE